MKRIVVICGIVVIAGAVIIVARMSGKKATSLQSVEQIQAERGIPVVTANPMRTNLTVWVRFDGVVAPNETATVMCQVGERVVRINVEEGDHVEGGENPTLLVELDDRFAKATADAADTAYRDAVHNLDRARALLVEGGISTQAYDQVALMVEHALVAKVNAGRDLANCRIFSPVSGYVARRMVDPGHVTAVGQLLMKIVDISSLKIEIDVPEKRVLHIRKGAHCLVFVDARSGSAPISSEIEAVNPALDPVSRQLKATCRIAGPSAEGIVPGMYARVELEADRSENAMVIPEHTVVETGAGRGVYAVVEGRAVFRQVGVGLSYGDLVEITDGLADGDRVIVTGQKAVTDGAKVVVVE